MIIGIDGASTDLSLALVSDDGTPVGSDAWASAQRQSAELFPRLLSLLDRHGLGLRDARAVGVGLGPGSYTGLRVAMSLAKGLCLALGVPLVGIPSLPAWLLGEPEAGAAVTRAGAREGYLLVRGENDPRVVEESALRAILADRLVVAPGELATALGLASSRPPAAAAACVGRLSAERLARSDAGGDDLHRLEPIYLRGPRGMADAPEGAVRWL